MSCVGRLGVRGMRSVDWLLLKLIDQKGREYKGKEYKKFWVVISNKLIEKLGWKSGEELDGEVKDKKLIIEKK